MQIFDEPGIHWVSWTFRTSGRPKLVSHDFPNQIAITWVIRLFSGIPKYDIRYSIVSWYIAQYSPKI